MQALPRLVIAPPTQKFLQGKGAAHCAEPCLALRMPSQSQSHNLSMLPCHQISDCSCVLPQKPQWCSAREEVPIGLPLSSDVCPHCTLQQMLDGPLLFRRHTCCCLDSPLSSGQGFHVALVCCCCSAAAGNRHEDACCTSAAVALMPLLMDLLQAPSDCGLMLSCCYRLMRDRAALVRGSYSSAAVS